MCGRALNGGAGPGVGAGAGGAADPNATENRQGPGPSADEEPPRKRARLPRPEDAAALRRAVLDSHLLRLKALRDRYAALLLYHMLFYILFLDINISRAPCPVPRCGPGRGRTCIAERAEPGGTHSGSPARRLQVHGAAE